MTRIVTGIDIESTGLEWEKGHRIIEIAAHLHDLDTGELKGQWVQRINPQRSIDPKAQEVHGIKFEDLVGCPTFKEVAPTLVRIMSVSFLVVAHNGIGFDFPFIHHELTAAGHAMPNPQVLDTLTESRWATPLGKSPSLEELCFACGVQYDRAQAHAASYDVARMMECFFTALKMGFYKVPEAVSAAESVA